VRTFGAISTRLCLLASIGLCAGLLALTPAAESSSAASLSLTISFFANGTISVTLPDGTPLGATSGAPTLIPAGFYTLLFSGPGGCTALPYFHLTGPGTNIVTNMAEGASQKTTNTANLQPSSTYVWSDDAFPGVVHTFVTSAVIEGTPPSSETSTTGSAAKGKGVSYQDIVGSDIVPFRGTLTAAVSAAGRLSVAYKGKSVAGLKAGKYTIEVTDGSSTNGFILQKLKHAAVSVTGNAFMGKRSVSVHLTPGKWLFGAGPGKTTYVILVS
jgi:hypothetical protein